MNVILAINDFTQTTWYWNSLKEVFILKMDPEKEPLMKDGFKSYNDYLEYYNSWDKRGKIRLKTKLDNLKKYLETRFWHYVDPIIYLA